MAGPAVYDAVVVGGGTAGVAAALAAARGGARVCLVERAAELGGNASQALVHTICGLYLSAEEGDARPANVGFANRFAAGLQGDRAAGRPRRAGRVWYLPVDPAGLARHARQLCERAADVDLRLGCRLESAKPPGAGHAGWQLTLAAAEGAWEAKATLLLDCSGDAVAAHLAGVEVVEEPAGILQHPSYIFRIDGVDGEALEGMGTLRLTHAVASAVRRGELAEGCRAVVFRGGLGGAVFATLNVPKLTNRVYAPLDDEYRLELESASRSAAEAIVEHLRRTRREFRGCRVGAWPERIGIRETRRVRGQVELTRDDVLGGRKSEDEIARSSWPIELWNEHRRARFEYAQGACSLPLGSLVSRDQPRLGMAGRCMAGSHEALGAFRVLGTALATGEALGVAAALAADRGMGLSEVEPEAVRAKIAAGEGGT